MVVAMTTHPRYQYKPEDLFLTVFVYIDDWLKPYQKGDYILDIPDLILYT